MHYFTVDYGITSVGFDLPSGKEPLLLYIMDGWSNDINNRFSNYIYQVYDHFTVELSYSEIMEITRYQPNRMEQNVFQKLF